MSEDDAGERAQELTLDGNAVAGMLQEFFGGEMTKSSGECAHCGGEMQQKRLDAVPWARHCIPCQEKQEQGAL